MTKTELKELYFDWICRRVKTDNRDPAVYSDLFHYLDSIDYIYTIPMDGNRYEDGISLRYRFADDCMIDSAIIASYLDDRQCSMLEMMAALALRCEEDIMFRPNIGDRTGIWFWKMIDSLGFGDMADGKMDREKADSIILSFFEHHYEPNGKGSLFEVNEFGTDMRKMELWNQMGVYLASRSYI